MAVRRLSDDEFQAIKAKRSGDALLVRTVAGDVIFRCPERDAFREMMRDLGGENKSEALERMIRGSVIDPDPETLDAWIERRPGIVDTCADPLLTFAGLDNAPPSKIENEGEDNEALRVDTAAGEIRLRCPTRSELRRCKDEQDDPKKRGDAIDKLVAGCVVDPAPAVFATLLIKKPGLSGTLFKPLQRFAGAEEAAIVKK